MKKNQVVIGFLLLWLLMSIPAVAAPLRDIPSTWKQPDGTVVNLLTSGDEHLRLTRTAEGYTVLRDFESGWLRYADHVSGRLTPTILTVGIDDPAAAGIKPGLGFTEEDVRTRLASRRFATRAGDFAPSTGQINNLFVFIRFADDDILLEESAGYENKFNGLGPEDASMRAFFKEVSRDAVDVRTFFLPEPDGKWMTAWTSSNSRQYYQPYDSKSNPQGYTSDSDAQVREHALLREALAAIENDIPAEVDFDANDDGWFDNVIFMVQGWPDTWSDLLWPHKWEFFDPPEVAGLKVGTYNLQLSILMLISPGTFAHEMYHSFGAPDLYHYSQDDMVPVGPWDLMESTGLEAAQHPLAYMKWKYGNWVEDIPIISENSEVTLSYTWDSGTQAVRIPVSESENEYFVIEYRRKQGLFDGRLPMSGLLVYRINPMMEGVGNRNGPPDEIYIFRPGGTDTENGNLKKAPLRGDIRAVMNEVTNPAPKLGNGTPVTLRVYDVGEAGDTMTFKVCLVPPGCGEKICGDDGYGGWCGDCESGNYCSDGACVPCTCESRECGDDGCGVSCGECDDENQCTIDSCEDWTCVFTVDEDAACDDGDGCTSGDTCDSQGTCTGTPYTCEPGICQTDSLCDGDGGCTPINASAGTGCDDGDLCTSGDSCDGDGECAGQPYTCEPGICQESSACDGNGGCVPVYSEIGTPCDDDCEATANDICRENGICRGTEVSTTDVIEDASAPEIVEETTASGGCSQTGRGADSGLPLLVIMMAGAFAAFRKRFKTLRSQGTRPPA